MQRNLPQGLATFCVLLILAAWAYCFWKAGAQPPVDMGHPMRFMDPGLRRP